MTLVVDASVACKWFFDEPGSDEARSLIGRDSLVAPELIVPEVANVCWKRVRQGLIAVGPASAVVSEVPQTLDELYPTSSLAPRALVMAEGLGHPVYDCVYLALAESMRTAVVTADARLARAVDQTAWRALVRVL